MGGSFPLGLFLLESSRLLATSLSGRHRKAVPHAEACWEKTLFHPVLLTCSSFLSLKPRFPAKNANGGGNAAMITATAPELHCFFGLGLCMCHLTSPFTRPEHHPSLLLKRSKVARKMLEDTQLLSGGPSNCPQVRRLKLS